ncbi:hypothetical protein [Maribellus sediminis]|uniref:hypothetical protein n=1 Tax=Maribellus sediminis TaxID=2696285 RepID=UPI0014300CD5|nr:hypothetical protein [Maribellus sediminis]
MTKVKKVKTALEAFAPIISRLHTIEQNRMWHGIVHFDNISKATKFIVSQLDNFSYSQIKQVAEKLLSKTTANLVHLGKTEATKDEIKLINKMRSGSKPNKWVPVFQELIVYRDFLQDIINKTTALLAFEEDFSVQPEQERITEEFQSSGKIDSEQSPKNNDISNEIGRSQHDFIPKDLKFRPGWKGNFLPEHIRNERYFMEFEKKLFENGFIDSDYNLIGEKKQLAGIYRILINLNYFKLDGRIKITRIDIRNFLDNRYQTHTSDQFKPSDLTEEFLYKLSIKNPWLEKLLKL